MPSIDIWNPFKEMKRVRKPLFEDWSSNSLDRPSAPIINIEDTGQKLEIIADLPGVDKKNISIDINENSLSLKTEIENNIEKENKETGVHYKEHSFSSFSKTISLPSKVIPNKANTKFENGLLKISLPKKIQEELKNKKFKSDKK